MEEVVHAARFGSTLEFVSSLDLVVYLRTRCSKVGRKCASLALGLLVSTENSTEDQLRIKLRSLPAV